jgi:hypothetical protein
MEKTSSPGKTDVTSLRLPNAQHKMTLKLTIKDTQILLDNQYNPFAVCFVVL